MPWSSPNERRAGEDQPSPVAQTVRGGLRHRGRVVTDFPHVDFQEKESMTEAELDACIAGHRQDAFRSGMASGIVLAALISLAVAVVVQWWLK